MPFPTKIDYTKIRWIVSELFSEVKVFNCVFRRTSLLSRIVPISPKINPFRSHTICFLRNIQAYNFIKHYNTINIVVAVNCLGWLCRFICCVYVLLVKNTLHT